ncbi:MAG: hypothetical protein FWF08_03920 [Oscillospiraceae bacterium]|nr:hypothetical protein [Oscillospiraceae bacterium]
MAINAKRLKIIVVSAALVFAFAAGAVALAGIAASKKSGSFETEIINRVNIYADDTEQVFKSPGGTGKFTARVVVSAAKTETDFYARINSISVSGMPYENVIITPVQGEYALFPQNAVLPGGDLKADGTAEPPPVAKWYVDITFSASAGAECRPSVDINYTSGVNSQNADTHILNIPVKLTVN